MKKCSCILRFDSSLKASCSCCCSAVASAAGPALLVQRLPVLLPCVWCGGGRWNCGCCNELSCPFTCFSPGAHLVCPSIPVSWPVRTAVQCQTWRSVCSSAQLGTPVAQWAKGQESGRSLLAIPYQCWIPKGAPSSLLVLIHSPPAAVGQESGISIGHLQIEF